MIEADRMPESISAISPKWSPGPSVARCSPPISTSALPAAITKKPAPVEPSVVTSAPSGKRRSCSCRASSSRSSSSSVANSGTLRRASTGALIAAIIDAGQVPARPRRNPYLVRTQAALYDEIDLELSWSEAELPERERTKHVHRLHPYLGKYVPQLVEVFLRRYGHPGRLVWDPFAGSGTTL